METKKTVRGEITALELKDYLQDGLVKLKRSGAGICLTFKKTNK